jgi:5,10-methylene-tetrahydrofolate dehydrogenase/methenyl tetrahydrofolate cyclohydrolase
MENISTDKDADVLSSSAREKFEREDPDALLPPVVAAIAEIFDTYTVVTKGKRAVVIGSGFLVGAPVATWLKQQGAEVVVLTSRSENVPEVLRTADIIVSGAGSPHLIKPEMLKEAVVLIDAGTSESGGVLAGDADPACATRCSLFTPVPGGVGPLAVAMLFENAVILAERATHL